MLAPYTSTTLYPTLDISTVPYCNTFIAGFIIADKSNKASWGGYHSIDSNFYMDIYKKLGNKKLIVSFGGAAGKELATVLKTDKLITEYKKVIDKFNLKSIDLDIEGSALQDLKACKRRGEAITSLLKSYPNLQVSLTLPVMPFGLSQEAIDCMNVTPHHLLNIMAMDFGKESDMGAAVINSINSVMRQTDKPIGVTVMIGVNDTGEIFSLQAAKAVKEFVSKTKRVQRISFWSLERDNPSYDILAKSSQIIQSKWAFTKIFS